MLKLKSSPRSESNMLLSSSFFPCLLFLLMLSSNIHARTTPFYTVNPKNISSNHDHGSKSNHHSTYTWHEFVKFQDARKGDLVDGISKLKTYFNRFGYLEAHDSTNTTDVFDSNLEVAITRYQEKLGIPVTGNLDPRTLSEIMAPRCGVGDVQHTTEHYVFFDGQPRWRRSIPMTLTYAVSPRNTIGSLSLAELREAFRRAFSHWASVIPVTFVESDDYDFADIKIGFYHGDHGDGEAFDGVLGVLAHAFSPESGRLHLDAAETWAVDFDTEKAGSAVDVESVATHEIGHVLGLAHTDVKEAVMYPKLNPRQKKVELKLDDIKGVQALYGSNPNFSFKAYSESELSSNGGFGWRVGVEEVFRVNWLMVLIIWLCM